MDGDQKFWVVFWCALAFGVSSVAWAVAWSSTIEEREAIKAGLVQVEYQSQSVHGTRWVNPSQPHTK